MSLTYAVDTIPPANPAVSIQGFSHIDSGEWQKEIHNPTFVWSTPPDVAGIQQYHVAWRVHDPNNPNAPAPTSGWSVTSGPAYTPTTLPDPNGDGQYELWLKTEDKVGNINTPTEPAFIFRYDNKPPTIPSLTLPSVDFQNSDSVTVSWTQSTDSGSGALGGMVYQVEVQVNGSGWQAGPTTSGLSTNYVGSNNNT
jgi:hypothetical protein